MSWNAMAALCGDRTDVSVFEDTEVSSVMKVLHDVQGLAIRLTDERRAHILEHAEMAEMESAIEETLREPERVVRSMSDPDAHLYYRFYFRTVVGGKFLCVVVKLAENGPFVLTAYLTNRMKKGERLWPNHKSI
jgi:hypothetical protein